MSTSWDDFDETLKKPTKARADSKPEEKSNSTDSQRSSENDAVSKPDASCDWGFARQFAGDTGDCDGNNVDDPASAKFIAVYEKYIQDKQSIPQHTSNIKSFASNPQKELQQWFDNEGHDFKIKSEQTDSVNSNFICSISIPVGQHDFQITSDSCRKKKDATDQICLAACQMLDSCDLLYPWLASKDSRDEAEKKRRFCEANKEDDIELDRTDDDRKRRKDSSSNNIDTYDSLRDKWNKLNMSIVQHKAKLVRMDISIKNHNPTNEDGDDDIDPLDAFMSNLDKKTELTRDEKIERSRIKSQIATLEEDQRKVARLIELAKPSFDLDKSCPKKN